MTILLLTLLSLVSVIAVMAVFLLGFRLGGDADQEELGRVRLKAARTERNLHDLTRDAFVAMTEAAERRQDQAARE